MAMSAPLRMFHPPFIWKGVATVRELEPIPLENKADWAVQRVNRRDTCGSSRRSRRRYYLVNALVIEFVDFEYLTTNIHIPQSTSAVPGKHLLPYELKRVLGAEAPACAPLGPQTRSGLSRLPMTPPIHKSPKAPK